MHIPITISVGVYGIHETTATREMSSSMPTPTLTAMMGKSIAA